MKKAITILAAGCLMTLIWAPAAYASVSWDTDYSVAGAAVVLNNYYASSLSPEKTLAETMEGISWPEEIQPAAVPPAQTSPRENVPVVAVTQSAYENVAISNVSNYVNVRTEPNTTSGIVGKIYNNCAATIEATVDGEGGTWYQIQSGTVKGYIKAEYFITGAEAEKIAKKVGTVYVTVSADTLRLREQPNTDSRTLTLLSENDEYVSLRDVDDFVEIQVDADLTGYVHSDYVTERVEFKQAVSLEEEAAQKAEEERLKKEADEAIAKVEALKQEAQAAAQESASQETVSQESSAQETTAAVQETTEAVETRATEAVETIAMNPVEDPVEQSLLEAENSKNETTKAPAETTKAPAGTTAQSTTANAETSKPSGFGPGGTGGPGSGTGGSQGGQNGAAGNQAGPGGGQAPGNQSGPSGGPGSAEITSATRTAMVAYARQFLGNPYVYGGTSLTEGADCSGFTMRIYEHFGIDIGRTSRDQAVNGKTISLDAIQPGDLIFYASGDYINHVAMYIGNGQVIHASTAATGIKISTAYYRTPYKAVTFLN